MQNYETIIGVLKLRIVEKIPRDDCVGRIHLGNGTYQRIEETFNSLGISYDELVTKSPKEVEDLFYPKKVRKKREAALPNYEEIYTNLHTKNKPTLFDEWQDYKKANPDGYMYSRFCELFKNYVKQNYGTKASMAINRIPGEKLFIDWVGSQPTLVLNEDNKLEKVHILVFSLGLSNMLFAKTYKDEKLKNFIDGTVSALNYYGAVPKYLVPDNLKTAITKHTKDELIVNSSYKDLEDYYDVVILPPPARKPTGKPTVERYVKFIETSIIPKLNKNIFHSYEELNEVLYKLINDSNNEYSKSLKGTKKETFQNFDLPQMRPLPNSSFTVYDYKFVSKVPNNYHVEYDNHYYSIPFERIDESVMIKASFTEIKIADMNNRVIYKHQRSYKPFPKYITVDEHMPSSHRYWKEINEATPLTFIKRANKIGPEVSRLVQIVLKKFEHEEQAYNSINGIIHLCDGISYVLANEAAKKCLEINAPSYSYFKRTLQELLDKKDSSASTLPSHKNIRGKDFYK